MNKTQSGKGAIEVPSFGEKSLEHLHTCDTRLITLCKIVIPHYDFSVLEGFRTDERQEDLLRQGKTTKGAGESRHNTSPSLAVDIAPYPIDWENPKRFYLLAGFMFHAAAGIGVEIRWGGDWDSDWDHKDQKFHDLPHFEVVVT